MRAIVRLSAALLVAVASARCGSSSTPPNPTDAGGSGTSDAGVSPDAGSGGGSGPDAGSGGTGGQPDAGSGGGGGQADAGTGGGGGQPDAGTVGGGGEPDAGTVGGGGEPDGGTGGGGGQPDAGGGGVAVDECDGLGPDPVGAPNGSAQLALSQLGHDQIRGATSDGSGVVALIESSGTNVPTDYTVWLYDQSGTPLGSYHGADTYGVNPQVTEQLFGFMVSDVSEDLDGRGKVSAVDEHGNVTASTGLVHRVFGISPYAFGGVVAVGFDSGGSATTVTWFDEAVGSRWQSSLPTSQSVFGVGDREGNTLVMLSRGSGNFHGIWIDRDGNVGSEFDAGNYAGTIALSPRVGNGVFLAANGTWVAQFDPFGGPMPAPDWLASRPAGTKLHMARNGRAYAVIAPVVFGTGSCSTTIDIVAPSGKSCGTAEFPTSDGGGCESAMSVGYDGTAIQQIASVPVGSGFNGVMSRFRWWTGYFH